jgi:carbamoyl-phosphate synthase small subunit
MRLSGSSPERQKCSLELSDGSRFDGELIGAPLQASGELVFTTGMVGYSEAMTDPSYFGQILVFTYPLIGNYGIPTLPKGLSWPLPRGFESNRVNTSAVILTIDSEEAFHWNSFQTLDSWLKDQGVPGIVGLDTRHLVHLVRQTANLLGQVTPEKSEGERSYGEFSTAVKKNGGFFDPGAYEIIREVSTKERVVIGKGSKRIGLVDCGVKWNIVRQLVELGCEVEILPWDTAFSKVDVSGWLLSNGPGDPKKTGDLVQRVAGLLQDSKPILGICLGHQILALAAGAETKRMAYGHRSHNQPVYQVGTRKGCITSQNHGYVVDESTLPQEWEAWFRNANDQENEGIKHKSKPFRSVQFHPEAAGGPRDTGWIIEQFVTEVKS